MEIEFEVEKIFRDLYKRSRFKALYGGRGGGKSWEVARFLIHTSNTYYCRILCCREIQKSIKDSSKKLLEDTIARMGLSSVFEITQSEIRNVITGAIFLFTGLQDHTSDSIKSFEGIDLCWVEEAHSISQKSLDILIPTIRKKNSQLIFTWNPDLPTDAVDRMFRGANCPDNSFVIAVDYEDNPHLSEEALNEAERLRKEDLERYLHVWKGHYRSEGDNQLISYSLIEKSIHSVVEKLDVPVVASVDLAREGLDRTAFVIRKGNEILFWKTWKKTDDYFPLASEIAEYCFDYDVKSINFDKVGVGAGFGDVLKRSIEGGVNISIFNGGELADSNSYFNKRAECWDSVRKWMINGGRIPNNPEWIADLVTIKYFYNEKSQKRLISKDKIKSEGGKSPDIGDALSMTFDSRLLFEADEQEYHMEEHAWSG